MFHRLSAKNYSKPSSRNISSFKVISSSVGRIFTSTSSHYWQSFTSSLGRVRLKAVDHALIFMRNSLLQVENVTVQKLRRTHGIASLYSRIYEQERLLEILRAMLRRCRLQSKKLVFSGAILTQVNSYDWTKEKLIGSDLSDYYGEIDFCQHLLEKTITCNQCGNRHRIEKEVEQISYCHCSTRPDSVYGVETDGLPWRPFIERKDIIVWRMENPKHKGMYVYKMYGRFCDVSAEEFLSVQLDMSEFRRSWDTNTAECHVVDATDDGSVVYYWEVNWPSFFSNRDYCCHRQHVVDPQTGMMVVVSRSTDHPNCPKKRKTWRVQDYWSVMTIKPFVSKDKTGMEFSLTAYEDPGVRLPEKIITWVAIRGMPEFMENLRSACIKLRKDKDEHKVADWGKETTQACSKEAMRLEGTGYTISQNQSAYA